MKDFTLFALVLSVLAAIFAFCLFAVDEYIPAVIETCCYLTLSIFGIASAVTNWKDKK